MKRFLIALQFLTILPVKITSRIEEKDLGGSLLYFPAVGLLIGGFLVIILFLFDFLPSSVYAFCLLATSVVITGGIHIDGLADTFDGLCGSHTKEEALNIMRDSRIGVMGAIAVILTLLGKYVFLSNIPHALFWKVLIIMPLFSRWAQTWACSVSPYVRNEGKAKAFIGYADKKNTVINAIITLSFIILLMGIKGAVLFSLAVITVALSIGIIRKRIGGMTGDTVGAVNEIAEISVLFFALVL